jgi:hypothetical protein
MDQCKATPRETHRPQLLFLFEKTCRAMNTHMETHTHTHTHTHVSLLLENSVCFPNLFNHSFMKSVRPQLGKGSDSTSASK